MTRAEHRRLFEDEVARLTGLTCSKNENYATADDAFANFRLIETLTNGRLSMVDGLYTRMSDKMARIGNLLGGVANNFESLDDNYEDLAVYAINSLIALRKQRETK